jgi:cation:H+ antiporter
VIYILFIIGFVVLIYGANLLVTGSSALGKRFFMPEIVIGLTIVSIGTSMPEMIISTFAAAKGNSDLSISNIMGSNIFNTLFIIGVAAIICPIKIKKNTAYKEIPFSLLAAFILGVASLDGFINGGKSSIITRSDGLMLLCFFIIFMFYSFAIKSEAEEDKSIRIPEIPIIKSILFIVLGVGGLYFGGRWIVDGAIEISRLMGLSEAIIGVTVIAVATSLPELVTSIVAARNKQAGIAIGNAIGSNIFNVFLVLGVSSVITPLPFNKELVPDLVATISSSLLVFVIVLVALSKKSNTITRPAGWLLIIIYFLFIIGKLTLFQNLA